MTPGVAVWPVSRLGTAGYAFCDDCTMKSHGLAILMTEDRPPTAAPHEAFMQTACAKAEAA